MAVAPKVSHREYRRSIGSLSTSRPPRVASAARARWRGACARRARRRGSLVRILHRRSIAVAEKGAPTSRAIVRARATALGGSSPWLTAWCPLAARNARARPSVGPGTDALSSSRRAPPSRALGARTGSAGMPCGFTARHGAHARARRARDAVDPRVEAARRSRRARRWPLGARRVGGGMWAGRSEGGRSARGARGMARARREAELEAWPLRPSVATVRGAHFLL